MKSLRIHRPLPRVAVALTLLAAAQVLAAAPIRQVDAVSSSSCTASGGTAARMRPYGGTYGPAEQWVQFGTNVMHTCTYTADDESQITIQQATLDSPNITTAAYAYYAMQPFKPVDASNPAVQYCKQVGGSTLIGDPRLPGEWATKPGKPTRLMCLFGDGSAIDAMGLFYHQAGIVRGIDLGAVLKYPNPF